MKIGIFFALLLTLCASQSNTRNGINRIFDLQEEPTKTLIADSDQTNDSLMKETDQSRAPTFILQIDSSSRLPSSHELDELILAEDTFYILKLAEILSSDDSINCKNKVDYLLQFLGRIRIAIEEKKISIETLMIVIDGAREEIKKLQNQIQSLEDQKKETWFVEIKQKLTNFLQKFEQCTDQGYNFESQALIKSLQVEGYEKELQILMKISENEKQRAQSKRMKLNKLESRAFQLEKQLGSIRYQRQVIMYEISQSQHIISANQQEIAQGEEEIEKLERDIDLLEKQIQQTERRCLEYDIEVKTRKAIVSTEEDKINQQIKSIRTQILIEEQKFILNKHLEEPQKTIKALQSIIPEIQAETNRQYYECYSGDIVRVGQNEQSFTYTIKGEHFGSYLFNIYGVEILQTSSEELSLMKVDIFSSEFISEYGSSPKLELPRDFSCLRQENSFGTGHIIQIQGRMITIRQIDDSELYINLGICTRVESTSSLPSIGMNLAFKGVASKINGYDVVDAISVTCW